VVLKHELDVSHNLGTQHAQFQSVNMNIKYAQFQSVNMNIKTALQTHMDVGCSTDDVEQKRKMSISLNIQTVT